MMQRLLQADPRWKDATIGKTSLKLGTWGCLVTCISMASDWFKCFMRPDQLAQYLKFTEVGHQQGPGLLYWFSVGLPKLNFNAFRYYGKNDRRIDTALANPDEVALIEVPLGRAKHWVLAIRKVPFTNHYFIADPLNKSIVRTTASYLPYTGYAILTSIKK